MRSSHGGKDALRSRGEARSHEKAHVLGGAYSHDEARSLGEGRSRPIPSLLWFALALWAGTAASYEALFSLTTLLRTLVFAIGAAMLLILVSVCVFRMRGRTSRLTLTQREVAHKDIRQAMLFGCMGGFVGLLLSVGTVQGFAAHQDELPQSGRNCLFVLTEDARESAYGVQACARVSTSRGERRVLLSFSDVSPSDLTYGTRFYASATFMPFAEGSVSYARNEGLWARAKITTYRLAETPGLQGLAERARNEVVKELESASDGVAALMAALSVGYRVSLNGSALSEDFRLCGLAHLIAVSGAHLALVTAMVQALLRALPLPRALRTVILAAGLFLYAFMSAFPVSVIRAIIMVFLGLIAPFARRRTDALSALAASIVGIGAVDPLALRSISFTLSASSTLGILLIAPRLQAFMRKRPPLVRTLLLEPLMLSLAALVPTFFVSAAFFSQLSLIAPLANVCAAPLFTVACLASLIAAISIVAAPFVAALAIALGSYIVSPLIAVAHVLAQVPYACVPCDISLLGGIVASVVLTAVCCLITRRLLVLLKGPLLLGAGAVAVVIVCACIKTTLDDEVVMLNVGQGDAFLVRSAGTTVLIDTGNEDQLIRKALARHGALSIDGVFITHADDDHCGSLDELRRTAEVDEVYVAQDCLSCPCDACQALCEEAAALCGGRAPCGLALGDAFRCGNFRFRVVWPQSYADQGGNADSLCLLGEYEPTGQRLLFTGDAEAEQLAEIVKENGLKDIAVLKVGHHGSKAALNDSLAAALSPQIALIGVGKGNRYGHPNGETLARLEAEDALIYRSDLHGDVALRFSPQKIDIATQYQANAP